MNSSWTKPIAHPKTISNIRSAKHDASLRSAEAAKIKKYKHLAVQEESTFLPLAISSFGHFSDSALKLVQLLATKAALQTGQVHGIAKDLKLARARPHFVLSHERKRYHATTQRSSLQNEV